MRLMDVADRLPEAIQQSRLEKHKMGAGEGSEVSGKATSRRVNTSNVTCLYTRTDKNHKLCALGLRRSSEKPSGFSN